MALLKAFRRRWVLALGIGFTLAVIVGVSALVLMPSAKYTTRSLLRVSMNPQIIIFQTQDRYADYRTFQNTQTQLIKSRVVLGPVIRNPKVSNLPIIKAQTDPAEWIEKQVEVSFPSGSELLTVSMSSSNPEELEPIVNSVVEAYLQTVVEEEHQARVTRLEQLRKLWDHYQDELRTKRASVRQLSNATGTDDRLTLALKQGFDLENVHSLERDLITTQAEMRRLLPYMTLIDARKTKGETSVTAKVPPLITRPAEALPINPNETIELDAAVEEQFASDPLAVGLRRKTEELQRKIDKLRSLARNPLDPPVQAARSELRSVNRQVTDQRTRIREALIARRNTAAQPSPGGPPAASSNIVNLRDQITMFKAREADLNKELETRRQAVTKLNGLTIDIQAEQDEIALISMTAQKIGSEVEALSVELQAPRRIVKLSDAEQPRKKDIARQYLVCGGAAFGALAFAMVGVSFWEMRAMRIDSVDEVVTNIGIPLVGALPALPSRNAKLSKAEDQRWQGLLVESIDATRTMLLHASRASSTRSVLITSAMKGEGKTSLAAHLATSLARSGRKTLLIDCDLRRPRLHQLFDVAQVPGLCELLRGEAELNDVIRPTPADDLNMIPGGHCDGLALQAIAQDGVKDILNVLKKRYDFIIIDSAPVLPVVDTLLLSQQVDAVLFSIMRDISRVPLVQAAHERLTSLGVKTLGAVVSAVDRREYIHTYDYEYQSVETV